MNQPRYYHTMTLLRGNGKVLVASGATSPGTDVGITRSAELYDPATGKWTLTADMTTFHGLQSATLLPDGRVLVAGGGEPVRTSVAEIFDPATGQWSPTASLLVARSEHTATLLPDGRVLIAGGAKTDADSDILASTELFDATLERWITGPNLTDARVLHQATLLRYGRVLVSGGINTKRVELTSSELLQTGGTPGGTATTFYRRKFFRQQHGGSRLLCRCIRTELIAGYRGGHVQQSAFGHERGQCSCSGQRRDGARGATLVCFPGQNSNFNIPAGTQNGVARVTILQGEQTVAAGDVRVTGIAPGLFSADRSGAGPPAGVVVRVKANGTQSFEPVALVENNRFVTAPIDLGPAGDQVVLVLYGTGIRGRSGLKAVSADVGTVACDVLYAGQSPDLQGVDQVNVLLSRSLAGSAEVDLELRVDGRLANTLRVNVR